MYCDRALGEAGDDRHLRIEIEVCAAYVTDFDMERASRLTPARPSRCSRSTTLFDTSIAAQACTASTLAELCLGNGLRRDLIERGVDLERENPPELVSLRATTNLGEFLMRCDDSAGARPLIERSLDAARETDESSLCEAILCAAQLELLTGDWSRADLLLRECLDVAEWTGQPLKSLQSLCFLAPLHAATGRSDAADLEIESTHRLAAELDNTNARLLATIAEGTVAFHRGDNALAAIALALADAEDERQHMREPGFRRYLGDLVEALLATGRRSEARDVLARLERMAARLDRPSALASAARGRALLEAEEGDVHAAIASCGEARTQHARLEAPFELARTLLVEASLRRRMRQKTAARALFDQAEEIFGRLDAVPWAERACQGSARIGGGAGVAAGLTPTERRVAELVATGMKNRDVAAALFMSPRSVEANLTKVYRKLGVSRPPSEPRSRPRAAAVHRGRTIPPKECGNPRLRSQAHVLASERCVLDVFVTMPQPPRGIRFLLCSVGRRHTRSQDPWNRRLRRLSASQGIRPTEVTSCSVQAPSMVRPLSPSASMVRIRDESLPSTLTPVPTTGPPTDGGF